MRRGRVLRDDEALLVWLAYDMVASVALQDFHCCPCSRSTVSHVVQEVDGVIEGGHMRGGMQAVKVKVKVRVRFVVRALRACWNF